VATGNKPPSAPSDTFDTAVALHRQGRLQQAQRLYRAVLAKKPDHVGSLHHLGVCRAQQGRVDEAVRLIGRAASLDPRSPEVLSDLGVALESAKRYEEAVSAYERALQLRPDYGEVWYNLGTALQALSRHEDAIERFKKALEFRPTGAEAHNNLGNSLHALGRHREAIVHFVRALAIDPSFALAESNLGAALQAEGRPGEAVSHFARAIALKPDYAKAHSNLGDALRVLGRPEEALTHLNRALALEPNNADAHNNLGNALMVLRRYEGAIASYRRAVELDPLQGNALSTEVVLKRRLCDWANFSRDCEELVKALDSGARRISPFVVTTVTDDPQLQMRAARRYVDDLRLPHAPAVANATRRTGDGKIRLAYLSGDFRDHTVAVSTAELFELHDRDRFQIFAFSFGPDDGSAMRQRLQRSFDRFVDVRHASDFDIARQMRALEIDVTVDLGGFTNGCRPAILAHRPSPVQVNYLGYPGTMGAEFVDYIVIDSVVVPAGEQVFFTEKLVHLPDCYLASDTTRRIAEQMPSRAECRLPEQGLVFAAFNNGYKITPPVFDVWMRLLSEFPGAVLWLRGDNPLLEANLRKEAAAREISPDRLVFAGRLPLPEHLARHRVADLFLDTLPYNAHSTALDALWAGLPVVTCAGRSFAARVAGSLLQSIGLPELVTGNLEEYEALARRLAGDPAFLAQIRGRLASNRSTMPLFNSDRLRRHLELAFQEMWSRWRRGEPPSSFSVSESLS